MKHQIRRTILALTVFAAAGAAEAHAADPLDEKLCAMRCTVGTIECVQAGGSEMFCAGFATGCALGCKISAA